MLQFDSNTRKPHKKTSLGDRNEWNDHKVYTQLTDLYQVLVYL